MKYWMGVIAADHAEIATKEGVCAFSHGKKPPVAKLSIGDRVLYYSPKTGISEGQTVQAITALATVTGQAPYEKQWAGTEHTAWVRAVEFTPIQRLPIKPLIEHLSFVSNPRYWGMAYRRGHFEIPKADFDLIVKHLEA